MPKCSVCAAEAIVSYPREAFCDKHDPEGDIAEAAAIGIGVITLGGFQ